MSVFRGAKQPLSSPLGSHRYLAVPAGPSGPPSAPSWVGSTLKPGAVPRSHPWTPECPRFGTCSWHPSAQESGGSVQRWGCGTALRPPGARPLGRTEAQTTATLARWPRDRFLTNTSTFGSTEPGRERRRGPSGRAAPRAGNVSSGMGQGVHGEVNVTQQEGKLRQGGRQGGKGRRVARGAPLPRRGGQTPGPRHRPGRCQLPGPTQALVPKSGRRKRWDVTRPLGGVC